jgi:hypothetical protein
LVKLRNVVICMLALIMVVPPDAWTQSPPLNNWTTVVAVPAGQKLVIELNSGKRLNGKLGAVSETGLSIVRGKKSEDISRSDIRKVHRESGASLGKSTLIGAGIGGGSGAIIGAAGGGCDGRGFICFSRGETAAALGVVGASIGSVAGLVIGMVRHKKTLIYEAT